MIKIKIIIGGLAFAVLTLAITTALAQQLAPAPATVAADMAATTTSNTPPRDPFWPVGYVPLALAPPGAIPSAAAAPGATITEDDWRLAQKRLITASIFRTKDPATGADRFLALINGKVVTLGEIVAVKHRDFTFRFKVANITAAGPQFERCEQ